MGGEAMTCDMCEDQEVVVVVSAGSQGFCEDCAGIRERAQEYFLKGGDKETMKQRIDDEVTKLKHRRLIERGKDVGTPDGTDS